MNWTKFSEQQPSRKGSYWIAEALPPRTPEGGRNWEIYPDYRVEIGSDGKVRGERGCYQDFDGCWYGPVELPFKLPALVPVG